MTVKARFGGEGGTTAIFMRVVRINSVNYCSSRAESEVYLPLL